MTDVFDTLRPASRTRAFVGHDANFDDAALVSRLYDELVQAVQDGTVSCEQLVRRHSELLTALDEHEAVLTIRSDRDTESAEAQGRLCSSQSWICYEMS